VSATISETAPALRDEEHFVGLPLHYLFEAIPVGVRGGRERA